MKSAISACLTVFAMLLSIQSFCFASDGGALNAQLNEARISSGKLYLPSADQMQNVEQLLSKAQAKGKLAIIAMGANWCHDSQSFAKKMYHPRIKPLIEEHYELLFVDVGYLTHVKEVITRFNQPVIYATPTVLVIDPASNIQVNQNNMHIWRDSAKLSVDETLEYFSDIVANQQTMLDRIAKQRANNTGKLAELNRQIDEFQLQQANRLYQAFAIIGPMLEKDEQGESVKNFRKYWKKVAKYRYQFTEDLIQLREQAVIISQSNEKGMSLEFPEYKAFEWEK